MKKVKENHCFFNLLGAERTKLRHFFSSPTLVLYISKAQNDCEGLAQIY